MIYRSNFRTLNAGGGTDGGSIFISEQLNHTSSSETVHLDFSRNSMLIAQLRIKIRRLLKIVWVLDWIESIPRLGLKQFDLVLSSGVLHHLKDPQKGLNIVNDVQLDDGGAQLMVYGKFGRTPVYQIQHLLKTIHGTDQTISNEISHTKSVLFTLPESNMFHQFSKQDIRLIEAVELYDLLLHKRDVSFDVSNLYQWSNQAGYHFVDFSVIEDMIPHSFRVDDESFSKNLNKNEAPKQQIVNELICGNMKMHDIYLSKNKNSEARLDIYNSNVIYSHGYPMGFRNVIIERSNHHRVRNKTFVLANLERTNNIQGDSGHMSLPTRNHNANAKFIWPSTEFNNFFIKLLTIDPMKPRTSFYIIDLFNNKTKSNLGVEEGTKFLEDILSYLKGTGMFYIKKKGILPFPKTSSLNLFNVFGII